MNEVRIITPPQSLVNGVLDILLSAGSEFDKSIVVFPGKRPAHFLRKAIAKRVGAGYLPPAIYSMETFLESLAAEMDPSTPAALQPEDAAVLLFDIHRQAEHPFSDVRYDSFDAFLPVGLKLFSELEEVMLTNLPVEKVHAVLRGIEFPRFRTFGQFFEEFYREVGRREMRTRAMLIRSVAENIETADLQSYRSIVLAGLYALTVPERIIVRSLMRRSNVHLVVQAGIGLGAQLQQIGVSIPEAGEETLQQPRLHYYESPDAHGQVFALAAKIQQQRTTCTLDERTVIVLPSADTLFPVVQHAISFLPPDGYNISLGYPLSRTPVYAFLKSILDLVSSMQDGKFSVPSYLRFILHPYTKNIRIQGRSDVTRILFHTLEEHLGETKSKVLISLEEIENDRKLFEEIAARLAGIEGTYTTEELRQHCAAIHRETIGKFLKLDSIGDFARRAGEVLEYIFEESTARQHPLFRPYVEQMMELLRRYSGSIVGGQKFQDTGGYAEFLRYGVGAQTVPFSGTPLQGVQILGFLETRNLAFDTVYLLDATDDVLPGGETQDLLLPYQVRKVLGLQTSRERELLSEYYFDLLLRSAKEVHLFYTSNNRKEKSRFIQKLQWQAEREDKKLSGNKFAEVVRYQLNLANADVAAVKKTSGMVRFIRNRMQFNATALNTYLACPLMFYYRYVLGLRERDEITDDVEASDIGTLVHAILKEYFDPLLGKLLSPQMFPGARLDEVIDRNFRKTYGESTSGAIYLMKEQVHRQLTGFVENYQIPLTEEQLIVTALEQSLSVEESGYRFSGRIDRVESRGGKNIMILDYKTGGDAKYHAVDLEKLDPAHRETWSDAIGSFQLPLYMLLYSNYYKRGAEEVTPAILFLGRQPIDRSIEYRLGGEKYSPLETYRAVKPVLFKLIDEICDPRREFTPAQDMEEHCPRCPYSAICGTQYIQRWDTAEGRK